MTRSHRVHKCYMIEYVNSIVYGFNTYPKNSDTNSKDHSDTAKIAEYSIN